MKIVVLDGYGANPGDLDWAPFAALGDLEVYDRTNPEDVVARSCQADILCVNKVLLTRNVLEQLPKLKYITLFSTGVNVVDLACAAERKIPVSNIPAYSTESVVESAVGHLLNLSARISESANCVRAGDWSRSPDFCFWRGPLRELAGRTLGVVGYGSIGRRVAQVALALAMNVIAYGPRLTPGQNLDGVTAVSLADLFRTADAVTLHCPLGAGNKAFVNRELLASMKEGALLVNTARGGLVDDQAVADALNSGHLGGYGADTLSSEPPADDNPLITARNAWITPHIAWATLESRQRLMDIAVANIKAFLAGTPQNVVS
ncbi:MAG: D-2-hydroxyacid dehydrogenase [Planctomycetia bacterium]|nr:D-2-hydroxyacid dehydrogenase [Planctomycetia bacterium]